MTHLHIAFSTDAGQLSFVVKTQNGAGWTTLDTLSQAGEGDRYLDYQAMIWALQYAIQRKAQQVTLYSHLPCIKAMLARRWVNRLPCIVVEDDSYVYNLTAWRLVLGLGGRVDFVEITRERNGAADEKSHLEG